MAQDGEKQKPGKVVASDPAKPASEAAGSVSVRSSRRGLSGKAGDGLYLPRRVSRRRTDVESIAYGNRLRVSPTKLNLVVQLIRGQKVEDAVAALTFSRKRAARVVHKVLLSAVANAENNHELNIDRLWVREALVGRDLVMKRHRARAKGRAASILKPFSNLRIVLVERGGAV